MIYTVTFNPALDYVLRMETLTLGQVNRAAEEELYFGGKGVNVSIILNRLGVANTALGFVAGFTGMALEKGVREEGVQTDFIHLEKGFSRINVKIKEQTETDLNARGPHIGPQDIRQLFGKLDKLTTGDFLVLAGSIPASLPNTIYQTILERLQGRGVHFVVDATGELLRGTLPFGPFLIKPNIHELEELFDRRLETEDDVFLCAQALRQHGARNVLVSMGGQGAVLAAETGERLKIGVAEGKVRNAVGAGDSMVAGFLAGYLQTGRYETALKLGSAAGNATAFAKGLATKEEILTVMDML